MFSRQRNAQVENEMASDAETTASPGSRQTAVKCARLRGDDHHQATARVALGSGQR